MTSYRDRLWFLLDKWINDAEIKFVEYDSQLTFVKEKFLDYILLTVHYCYICQVGSVKHTPLVTISLMFRDKQLIGLNVL